MSMTRRWLLQGLVGSLAGIGARAAQPPVSLGMTLTEEQMAAGRALLASRPSVDIHAHPGRFFLRDIAAPTPRIAAYGAPFEDKALAAMQTGKVSAALFSAVADTLLLDFSPTRGLFATRAFAPGEAWAEYQRQRGTLRGLLKNSGVLAGRTAADVVRAHQRERIACIFAIEGGDFIEADLDRVHQAHRDGVRCITIVHYTVNQIGDIQTAPAVHGGLTPLGARIVREMNRTGILVDVAHATLAVTRGAVEAADRPMLLSHSNIAVGDAPSARLITAEHARLVARDGGVIGSIPWGVAQTNFSDWIDSIRRLVDLVGIDAVAIGTDMDATFNPVFDDYRQWALVPAALLVRGFAREDVAKVLGGNFLRVFAQANSAANISRPSRPVT